ncbi:MAG TPA: hypothetical protein VGB54_11255 [Allosphingosinicella sp.]|jgi:hypothetical protein
MAAIDLSAYKFRTAGLRMLDFGGEIVPPLGGPVQRINRLGNRFSIELALPPIRQEPEGRILAAKLRLAKQNGALYTFPQPGLVLSGAPTGAISGAVAGGTAISISGLSNGQPFVLGQFISIIVAGRRYVHGVAADTAANAGGVASLTIDPMLRVSLSAGQTVEIAEPKLEGLMIGGDSVPWNLELEPFMTFDPIVITESE